MGSQYTVTEIHVWLHSFTRSQPFTRSHVHTLARSHAHTLTRSHAHTLARSFDLTQLFFVLAKEEGFASVKFEFTFAKGERGTYQIN